jgi:sulfoxide reductase heme-binding subunit YedZ
MADLIKRINKATRRVPPWVLYALAPIPAIWWFYLGLSDQLGAEPINALERLYGEFALQLLILGLAVTPLRTYLKLDLIRFRRAIGVIAFSYVALHLLVWLALDVQILSQIWADILKRPYITVGMTGFLLLLPLAATSNNWSVRRLGPLRWKMLHKLTYGAVLLGAVHGFMVAKGIQFEPLIYLGLVIMLLALRWVPARRRMLA